MTNQRTSDIATRADVQTSESLRPAFEAWAKAEFSIGFAHEDDLLLNRSGDGYDDPQVDGAWMGLLYARRTLRTSATACSNFQGTGKCPRYVGATCPACDGTGTAPAHTGLTDTGFILESANAGELAAHDHGCNGTMAALRRILDGEDIGAGAANEPWESLRRRVLDLVRATAAAELTTAVDTFHEAILDIVGDLMRADPPADSAEGKLLVRLADAVDAYETATLPPPLGTAGTQPVNAELLAFTDEDPERAAGVEARPALDLNKVQACRRDPVQHDKGQPCGCPARTCIMWKDGAGG